MKKTYEAPFVEYKEFKSEEVMATNFASSIKMASDVGGATIDINFN